MNSSIRRPMAICIALGLATSGCVAKDDLGALGCLPLKVPAKVVLLVDAGLYTARGKPDVFLNSLPRDTTNDGFHGIRQLRVLRAGTTVDIRELTQARGFDIGKGRISAFGATPDGQRFEYGWGGGTTIGRAPWEPASVPPTRTVDCKH